MSTQPTSIKTDQVANTIGNNLTTINSTQAATSTSATAPVEQARALKGAQYNRIYNSQNSTSGSAPVPGEKATAKSGGGDDIFSGIARAITSAVNVAMAVVNPLSAVANAADTVAKATNKKT